jgi:hypothetical protein
MKCASCDVYIEPSYMPCPQCKRRAGYTLIEDTSRCSDIYDLAFSLINSDQLASSSVVQLNMQTIVDKNFWASATEGSLSAAEIEGLAAICQELKIDRMIGLLPENLVGRSRKRSVGSVERDSAGSSNKNALEGAHENAHENLRESSGEQVLALAFVETSEDALRNFSWDFPLSFVLFPPNIDFLICQYSHPAILAVGPKLLVERVFNLSIEESIEQFKDDMENSQATTLAAYLIENVITPANSSAAK